MIVGSGLNVPTNSVTVAIRMETVAVRGAAHSGTVQNGAADPAMHGGSCRVGQTVLECLYGCDGQ